MKKYVMSIVVLMILTCITGCGNSGTLTCTKTETKDGNNIEDTMIVTYKNNKVIKVEETNITEMDKDMVDMTVSFGTAFSSQLNEVKGFNAVYSKESDTKVKYVITVNYEELDLEQLKSKFETDFKEVSFYSSKDMTLDNFKENNLSDYTCK